jgi:hypothetical protein
MTIRHFKIVGFPEFAANGNDLARRFVLDFDLDWRFATRSVAAAISRNRGDVVLGFAGFPSDHDAQGGRLAKPQRKAIRSDD